MVLLIIIPMKNGYFIGNIPYFQTNPFGNLGTVAMLGLLTSAFSPAFPALPSSHELLQAASSWMSMSSCTEMAPGLQSSADSANISNISKLGVHPGADVNFGCFKLAVSGLPQIPCWSGTTGGGCQWMASVVSFGQCPVPALQEGPFRSGWLRDQPHPRGRGSIGIPLCFLLVACYFSNQRYPLVN